MMGTILLASIVWIVFLISNLIVGFIMYRTGLQGKARGYTKDFNSSDIMDRVSQSLGGHIPGSEFNPFETQHEPRYDYLEPETYKDLDTDEDDEFAPDPLVPKGGEDDGESEREG